MEYKSVDYGDSNRPPDRRFRIKPRKGFRVSKIWENHHEIKRRILLGQKNTIIAEALGCSVATVSNVRNSPIIQDELAVMRGARDAYTVDIARDIQEFAPKALDLLKDLILGKGPGENASIALRGRYASNWLDRAGYSPVRKEQKISTHLTAEEIEGIKERAFKAMNQNVVEAEYTDNSIN
jgi:hypothetical protein